MFIGGPSLFLLSVRTHGASGWLMSALMNPAEFANIRQCEEHFWWYRGMRAILFRMLQPHLAGRQIDRALEAGCGTG